MHIEGVEDCEVAVHLVAVVMAVKDEGSEGLAGCVLGGGNPLHNCLQGFLYANALLRKQGSTDLYAWAEHCNMGHACTC